MGVKVEYFKDNITLDNLSEYKLFFLLRKGSLSFLVKERASGDVVYFKSLLIQESLEHSLAKLLEKDSILSRFEEVEVLGVNVDAHSLVPGRLFDENSLSAYFEDLYDLKGKELSFAEISGQDVFMIFAHSSFELEILKKYFRIGLIKPNIIGLIESAIAHKEEEIFLLHIEEKKMNVSYIQGDKLTFLNHFNYSSSADVLYYVLKIMSLVKLDPKRSSIYLDGNIVEDSEIYKVLFRYVNKLEFFDLSFPEEISFKKEELHYFNDIFALSK